MEYGRISHCLIICLASGLGSILVSGRISEYKAQVSLNEEHAFKTVLEYLKTREAKPLPDEEKNSIIYTQLQDKNIQTNKKEERHRIVPVSSEDASTSSNEDLINENEIWNKGMFVIEDTYPIKGNEPDPLYWDNPRSSEEGGSVDADQQSNTENLANSGKENQHWKDYEKSLNDFEKYFAGNEVKYCSPTSCH